jgi:hypothetical protein
MLSSINGVDAANVRDGVNSSQPAFIARNPSAAPHAVIVSPPVEASGQASERNEDFVCALFDKEINVEDIPSKHICPLTQEPPIEGVDFDITDANGNIPLGNHQGQHPVQLCTNKSRNI